MKTASITVIFSKRLRPKDWVSPNKFNSQHFSIQSLVIRRGPVMNVRFVFDMRMKFFTHSYIPKSYARKNVASNMFNISLFKVL